MQQELVVENRVSFILYMLYRTRHLHEYHVLHPVNGVTIAKAVSLPEYFSIRALVYAKHTSYNKCYKCYQTCWK